MGFRFTTYRDSLQTEFCKSSLLLWGLDDVISSLLKYFPEISEMIHGKNLKKVKE